jgi:hypothetical protein
MANTNQLDLYKTGTEIALTMCANSQTPEATAKLLIARMKDGQDDYSRGLTDGAHAFLKGKQC